MEIIGLIAEYNPFHNGHLYQIKKVKELYKDSTIIVVLSGNFLERGDVSIIDKWTKTKIALEYGVDLVIELPFPFATQSADIFAHGAISILNELKVEKLVFGSETNDIDTLTMCAKTGLNNKKYDLLVKQYLNEGINYPTALSKALSTILGKTISSPNDLLGVSYIKEIIKQNSSIEPIPIKRTNNYHDEELNDVITSATSIRKALSNDCDIKDYVPKLTYNNLKDLHFLEDYFNIFKYKVLTEKNLSIYQTVDEGIENRLTKEIIDSSSFSELIKKIKTKRYTYNKLQRMFIHILCNFTKEEANTMKNIEYIRILGFSNAGKNYLNKIKKQVAFPIISNYSRSKSEMLKLEFRSTCVYASILNEEKKINLIKAEYQNHPLNH